MHSRNNAIQSARHTDGPVCALGDKRLLRGRGEFHHVLLCLANISIVLQVCAGKGVVRSEKGEGRGRGRERKACENKGENIDLALLPRHSNGMVCRVHRFSCAAPAPP
jgi:hypothetical protein